MHTLRLTTDAAAFTALQNSPHLAPLPVPARARRLVETYYDTEAFTLAKQGMALVTARAGRGHKLRLNWDDTALEVSTASPEPDLADLGPEWEVALRSSLQAAPLNPAFITEIKRITRQTGEVEVRFESGFIKAGAEKLAIHEVELRGPEEALYQTALDLADTSPLLMQAHSLAARGAQLAGGPMPIVQKAGSGLTGEPSLDEAVLAISQSCIRQFIGNWPVFAEGDAVSAVHQMRVALRRLRSVLGLFHRAIPAPEFSAFRTEAKRLANVMGEARNWDVFAALVEQGPARAFPEEPGFAALFAQCTEKRSAAHAGVRALLAAPETTRFVLTVEAFLARRGWRNVASAEALRELSEPALGFATATMARLHRKVAKRGKHMARLGEHERHLVRIELKKLRYAGDLFSGLFTAQSKVRGYNKIAARLQEDLGLLNDLATAKTLLRELDGREPDAARAIGIVLGWCAYAARADDKELLRRWGAFSETKPLSG
jgi:inorganic triphosphatase YgiF